MLKFGYTIIYVPDVVASLSFFERAFGIPRRFLHESGTYGECETGETALAFAYDDPNDGYFAGGHIAAHAATKPLGIAISLVTPKRINALCMKGRKSYLHQHYSLGGRRCPMCIAQMARWWSYVRRWVKLLR
jgi:catechol 2,3-dioxygenase-like lactoylglutathione lyase family enzyme